MATRPRDVSDHVAENAVETTAGNTAEHETAPAAAPNGPAAPAPNGSKPAAPSAVWLPHSFYRTADGTIATDLSPKALAAAATDRDGVLWVDVDSNNRHQHAVLEKIFQFHPLAIEDTLSPNSRVKFEEYPGFLFVIARGVKFARATADPYDVETLNLYFFLGPNFLVTVHSAGTEAVDAMTQRVSQNPDLLGRGPARLMHYVLDLAIDAYFPILDCVDDFIDDLEERVFNRYDEKALHDIFSVKRLVLTLRRHLAPQREVLNQLSNRPTDLLPASAQVYYRDVYDHVLRINDSLDTYRELLSSTLDSYLSQVSNRLSQSSKGLTVVATVTLPFVIMSGMWGMNFTHIPLSDRPHGFALLMGLQCLVAAVLLILLRWRRLL